MVDSERTLKIKVRSSCIVFVSTYLKFCTEKRLSNNFKITNVTKFTKGILKSSYGVLQVTSKWETLKQPVYFLRTVGFWPTFDIQISITFAIFWEKLQKYTFQKAHRSFSKQANIYTVNCR